MDITTVGKIIADYVQGVIILNKQHKVIWRNDIYEEIYNGEEILGKDLSDICSLELSEISKKSKIIKNLSGKKYDIRCKNIKEKDEEYALLLINEITDFNNKDIKLYCLEKIVDAIDDGIIVSNYDGQVVLYNSSQEAMEDLDASHVIGTYLWECYNYKPELSEHRKVYRTSIPILNKYQAHAYKDGIPKYITYSTYPIIKDGEIIAVYSISKNENKLQSLLHETLDLKRKMIGKNNTTDVEVRNNGTRYTFADIIGNSSMMSNLIKEAETIALLNSPILIVGETGTGKEVFAQSIHNYSDSKQTPFVDINCSAIPENLLESILFGTKKGSYTGAIDQPGLFEEAGNGTLFLDEINSMPISMQSKLLRVLQEKKVRRVGGLNSIPISCRIISAVNEDPQKTIQEGRFRQDLYYRIAGASIFIPPLRERKIDILCTAEFFIDRYNKLLHKNVKSISKELTQMFLNYKWLGNVRELEHVIENIMIRTPTHQKELTMDHLPHYLKDAIIIPSSIEEVAMNQNSLSSMLRDMERKLIMESLDSNNWNISKTAKNLGIIRQSLEYRMKKLKITNVNLQTKTVALPEDYSTISNK